MAIIDRYRYSYEHEKDANNKMLTMIESVPEANRTDARFQQAVTLAGHLAACRENWLDYMDRDGNIQVPWFDPSIPLSSLRPRFVKLERQWTTYLARLDDEQIAQNFDFPISDTERYSLLTETQIVQLIGHAAYHRGQIALLVDQLGGETVDTDYADWADAQSR